MHLISWPRTPSVEEIEFWERHGRIEDLEDPEARSIALTLRAWLPEWIRSNGGHAARPARRGDVVALLAHWMNNAAPQDLEVPGGQVYLRVAMVFSAVRGCCDTEKTCSS